MMNELNLRKELNLGNFELDEKLKLLKNIQRSFSVYRIDCGSCNGCEIEIFAAISPLWDPERFGFKLVSSPRHADILVITGPITRQMYYPLLRAYDAAPDPKIVVALGACGSDGGIFHDSYAVWGGADKVIPVDVFIPGCPPHPVSIIYGFATALGLIDQKLHHESSKDSNLLPEPKSVINDPSFERDLFAKAKALLGFHHARTLCADMCEVVASGGDLKSKVEAKMSANEDPRMSECLGILYNEVCAGRFHTEALDIKQVKWQ